MHLGLRLMSIIKNIAGTLTHLEQESWDPENTMTHEGRPCSFKCTYSLCMYVEWEKKGRSCKVSVVPIILNLI